MSDDRHPEELLAAYAEGGLAGEDRAAVEAHLSSCERCREELALSIGAVALLRQIPEEPVPLGVMSPVTAEIGRRTSATTRRPLSQRALWAAGGAIAAAFVGIVAVSLLPGIGSNDAATSAGRVAAEAANPPQATAAGGAALPRAPVTLEHQSTDYDDAGLRRLATGTATHALSGSIGGTTDARVNSGAAKSATSCLEQGAVVQPQDVLVRLIDADYEGKPAIIGVYLTSSVPGRSPDGIVVWVVRADTCRFANITTKRI